jgi:pSer/pThr/pTyr-binding forkhead associated (FHA) protein
MQIKLIVVEGQSRRKEFVLELPAVVGRSRAANVTVGDPKVSRHHCELFESAGVVMVRDNNSLNGTLLDGEKVTEKVVRPGARLTVGPLTFVVLYEPTEESTQEMSTLLAPATPNTNATQEPDFTGFVLSEEGDAEAAAESSPPDLDFLPPAADPALPPQAAADVPLTPIIPPSPAPAIRTTRSSKEPPPAPVPQSQQPVRLPADQNADKEPPQGESPPPDEEDVELQPAATKSPKPPKKKKSWWPFGKKQKSAAKPAEKPEPAASEEPEPSSGAQEAPAVPDTADAPEEDSLLPAPAEEDVPPYDEEDDELNDFLKGLGK